MAVGAAASRMIATVPDASAAVEDPLSGRALHRDVERVCGFGWRRTDSPQERRAARWLARKLGQAGCTVDVEPYRFPRYRARDWSVRVTDASVRSELPSLPWDVPAYPRWYTAPDQLVAQVVYVGAGTEAELDANDVKGKVVLVDGKAIFNVFPTYSILETYYEAAERGAAGFVATSDAPHNSLRLFTYANQRLGRAENPIPGFTVGRLDFERLRQSSLRGLEIALELDAVYDTGRTQDVLGILPGGSDDVLLVCAHYDSTFTGAMDNGTGVAGLLGLARHFGSKPRRERPKTMWFLGISGHDTGFPHLGVNDFVRRHRGELGRITTFLTLDHLSAEGSEDAPGATASTGLDEERGAFVSDNAVLAEIVMEAAASHGLLPTVYFKEHSIEPNPDMEGRMVEEGVPAVNITMAYPWYHTMHDTPDKIPAEQLARCVAAYRQILDRLHALPASLIRSGDLPTSPLP